MSRGKRNFFAAGWDGGADRGDPRKPRPAPTCQHIRKEKRRTACLCVLSWGAAKQRGPQPPAAGNAPFSSPAGKRNGKEMGRTCRQADREKERKHRQMQPPLYSRRAGAARPYCSLLRGLVPRGRGQLKARRVKAAVDLNGGRHFHADATQQRGNHKENDW